MRIDDFFAAKTQRHKGTQSFVQLRAFAPLWPQLNTFLKKIQLK
jgi:hypothetical protein